MKPAANENLIQFVDRYLKEMKRQGSDRTPSQLSREALHIFREEKEKIDKKKIRSRYGR